MRSAFLGPVSSQQVRTTPNHALQRTSATLRSLSLEALGGTRVMDISNIHFHDSRILRVIEDTASDTLTMEVQYPTDWQQGIYELRHLVFEDAYAYAVTEGPLHGSPTILEASIVGSHLRWSRLRLDTNAGFREVFCVAVRLAAPRAA